MVQRMGSTRGDMQKHAWVSKLELSIFDRSVLSTLRPSARKTICLRSYFTKDIHSHANFGRRLSQEESRY